MPSSYLLKCPPGDPGWIDRMQALARERGVDFARFVRDALEERADAGGPVMLPEPMLEAPAGKKGSSRREPCIHRVPPAAFCKECD